MSSRDRVFLSATAFAIVIVLSTVWAVSGVSVSTPSEPVPEDLAYRAQGTNSQLFANLQAQAAANVSVLACPNKFGHELLLQSLQEELQSAYQEMQEVLENPPRETKRERNELLESTLNRTQDVAERLLEAVQRTPDCVVPDRRQSEETLKLLISELQAAINRLRAERV